MTFIGSNVIRSLTSHFCFAYSHPHREDPFLRSQEIDQTLDEIRMLERFLSDEYRGRDFFEALIPRTVIKLESRKLYLSKLCKLQGKETPEQQVKQYHLEIMDRKVLKMAVARLRIEFEQTMEDYRRLELDTSFGADHDLFQLKKENLEDYAAKLQCQAILFFRQSNPNWPFE